MQLPRLFISDNPHNEREVYCGHGCYVESIDPLSPSSSPSPACRVFDREASIVHGILPLDNDLVLVYGERSLAVCTLDEIGKAATVPHTRVKRFLDWILNVAIIGDEVVILFTTNVVLRCRLVVDGDVLRVEERERVHCDVSVVLMSALLLGPCWSSMECVVGTVFGDILTWRPAHSPAVHRKLTGHTGMVFSLASLGAWLVSVSDDRSVRVWRPSTSSDCLASSFGHSARPYALAVDGRGEEEAMVYTAGVDQVVCTWRLSLSAVPSLTLIHRHPINIGAIRALHVLEEGRVLACSESGALVCVSPPPALPSPFPVLSGVRALAVTGRQMRTVHGDGSVCVSAASPDGFSPRTVDVGGARMRLAYGGRETAVAWGESSCVVMGRGGGDNALFTCGAKIVAAVPVEQRHGGGEGGGGEGQGLVVVYDEDNVVSLLSRSATLLSSSPASAALAAIGKTKQLRPTCACVVEGYLFIGSLSGHVLSAEWDGEKLGQVQIVQCVTREVRGQQIVSMEGVGEGGEGAEVMRLLAKNTPMLMWRVRRGGGGGDGAPILSLLSRHPISAHVEMDWPCRVERDEQTGKEYVIGFHSTSFLVVDVSTGHRVLCVECGGGNRPWHCYISVGVATLWMVRNEELFVLSSPLQSVVTVRDSLHRGHVQFARMWTGSAHSDPAPLMLSGGADTQLVLSSVDAEGFFRVLHRVVEAAGVVCGAVWEEEEEEEEEEREKGGKRAVVGGGKGRVTVWRVEEREHDQYGLVPVCEYVHPSECRVVDVAYCEEKRVVLAAMGDGAVRLFSPSLELLSEFDSPDLSMYSKVVPTRTGFAAVSTSGRVSVWHRTDSALSGPAHMKVERCGVSAAGCGGDVLAVGSESGRVSVLRTSGERLAEIDYHAATVTDVSVHVKDGEVRVRSVAIDSRLAEHCVDVESGEVRLVWSRVLAVADPASLTDWKEGVVVAGNGLECVKIP